MSIFSDLDDLDSLPLSDAIEQAEKRIAAQPQPATPEQRAMQQYGRDLLAFAKGQSDGSIPISAVPPQPPAPSMAANPVVGQPVIQRPHAAYDPLAPVLAALSSALANISMAKGERGPQGPQGTPGRDGVDGIDGTDGRDGLPGMRGPQGEKGEKGDKGERGEKGDRGPRGHAGGPGVKGDKGEPGDSGTGGGGSSWGSLTLAEYVDGGDAGALLGPDDTDSPVEIALDCGGAFQATRRMTIDGGGNAKGEL